MGAEIALATTLTGSLDLGYGARAYKDPRLPDLSSPLFDASLIWTATPLTTVTLKSSTALAETTIKGASGAAEFSSVLEVDHALRRYLTITASLAHAQDFYTGLLLRDFDDNCRPWGELQPQPRRRAESDHQPRILRIQRAAHELWRHGRLGRHQAPALKPSLRNSSLSPGAMSGRPRPKARLAARNRALIHSRKSSHRSAHREKPDSRQARSFHRLAGSRLRRPSRCAQESKRPRAEGYIGLR